MNKVGIIGGGASGLVSAWLLEDKYEVILFEQSDKLGGHADTQYINVENKNIAVETGFEFFNPKMFPYLFKLLKLLNVPIKSFNFNYTYFKNKNKDIYVLPPFAKNKIYWNTFYPYKIFNLLQLKFVIYKGQKIIDNKDCAITLEQFLNSLLVTNSFKNNFFFPLFCAGWGVKPDEFKTFSAYNILCWIIKNQPMGLGQTKWYEVEQGVSFYIKTLSAQLTKSKINLNYKIDDVSYDGQQYCINDSICVDHLIIATNANDASTMLKKIDSSNILRDTLGKVEYVHTTIAIHSDQRFMPDKKNWSIANVYNDGINSMLTIYKDKGLEIPVFRSWVFKDSIYPDKLYAIKKYKHAKPNIKYFEAQKELETVQGKNNLWIAGLYTHDIDSHESAIVSAIKIAQKLAPESTRLNLIKS